MGMTSEQHQAADLFARDVVRHQMRVLLDQGIHRHLQFRSSHSAFDSWFDLITYPGGLTVTGCRQSWTFRREYDMFGFFRAGGYRANPQYHAEKLQTPYGAAKEYSKEAVFAYLADTLDQWQDDDPDRLMEYLEQLREFAADMRRRQAGAIGGARSVYSKPRRPKRPLTARTLRAQIRQADEDGDLEHEQGARGLLYELEEQKVVSDTWEWDLHDYHFDFLWSLHAVCWGVKQYDTAVRSGAHRVRSALVPWDQPHPTVAPARPGPLRERSIYDVSPPAGQRYHAGQVIAGVTAARPPVRWQAPAAPSIVTLDVL